jgi:ERCC4-type nuclease
MEATRSQIESLKTLLKEMSAADLSILEAVPETLRQEETVRLATTSGSKNDVLWSQMAALNWMELDDPLEASTRSTRT